MASITARLCIRGVAILALAIAPSPLEKETLAPRQKGLPLTPAWFEPADRFSFRGRGSASRVRLRQGGTLELLDGSASRLTLPGANNLSVPRGIKRLPGTTNIYRRAAAGLLYESRANYAEVRYREVYPKIDLVYH